MRTVAIIPARGGSKGIPRKNLVEVCGKPLIAWSIEQARASAEIESVWVTSDDAEILETAERFGARPIRRPDELSDDSASSESAWSHAVDTIEADSGEVGLVVAMQATSPIRDPDDIDRAVRTWRNGGHTTLLSVVEIHDYFMWRRSTTGECLSVNYDWRDRRRRQAIEPRFLENGSLYLFTPQHLRETGNRLGGRIGFHLMRRHTLFQIDEPEDLHLVEGIMTGFGLAR
jgi:N-acylneuraminate cytidylyltransferase